MNRLSGDDLLCIFSYIRDNAWMINCTLVCKQFRDLMRTGFNLKYRTLHIKTNYPTCDVMIMNLVHGWNELQNVFCSSEYLSDESVRLLLLVINKIELLPSVLLFNTDDIQNNKFSIYTFHFFYVK